MNTKIEILDKNKLITGSVRQTKANYRKNNFCMFLKKINEIIPLTFLYNALTVSNLCNDLMVA